MQSRLIEGFFHGRHRVIGRRLRPFTLRHAFVLAASGSPFLLGGAVTPGDLLLAVEVASRPGDYFLRPRPIRGPRRLWLETRLALGDMDGEAAAFDNYLADYMTGPQPWEGQGDDGSRGKVNWILTQVAALMHLFSWSEAQAWATPPGAAAWYATAGYHAHPMAKIDVVGDREAALLEELEDLPDPEELLAKWKAAGVPID